MPTSANKPGRRFDELRCALLDPSGLASYPHTPTPRFGVETNILGKFVRRTGTALVVAGAGLAAVAPSFAIVTRHDVPVSHYLAEPSDFPQLADMPGAGHGVLIAPRWVVTAAHTIQGKVTSVMLAGQPRAVDRVIMHPGYRVTPQPMIDRALATKDGAEIQRFLADNHDIALVRLVTPIRDIAPANISSGNGEVGATAKFFGKGATGDGLTGVSLNAQQRTVLRRAYNRISKVEGRWIVYRFDRGPDAHRLEGMSGSGDSGGPVLIRQNGRWAVAGLTSWQSGNSSLAVPVSRYGQLSYNARLAYYADWIKKTQSSAD